VVKFTYIINLEGSILIKRFILLFFCSLLLTSCTSKEHTASKQTDEQSEIIKKVDALIKKGEYSEAGKQIEKNGLLEGKKKGSKYNYKSLIAYLELKKLYEQKEYQKVLGKYTYLPIKDKFLSKEVTVLLKGSADQLIEKEYYSSLERFYEQLDAESKDTFKYVYLAFMEHEHQETSQPSTQSNPIEQYLKYMEEGNYAKIAAETTTDLSLVGENFFNLSTAYDNFYNNPDMVYIKGEISFPESCLNNISNPLPEVKPYIEKLKKEIRKKEGSAKDYGVHIGMTKEQVINSSWEKPKKMNTTTSKFGTREQWVYGAGNYLYFENDILTSIQN
jgi:hypothetical protein